MHLFGDLGRHGLRLQDVFQARLSKAPEPAHGVEQGFLAHRTETDHVVKDGFRHTLASQFAMERNREAMAFVSNVLHEV